MTSIPKRIYSFANYFWFAAGTGLMLLTPLAITVVLNRTGSSQDLGLYAFAYAVTAPMQAFLGIQARTFIAIDRLYGHDAVDMAAQRFHMAAGLFLGVGLIAVLRGFQWHEVAVFAAMCMIRTAEGFAEVSAGMLQRRNRPDLIALTQGARAVAAIAIFAWLYYLGFGLPVALAAMAAVSLVVFIFVDRSLLGYIGTPLRWSEMAKSVGSRRPFRLIRHLLPAGLVVLLSVAETNLPRYMVEGRIGLVELGMFASLGFALSVATNLIHPVYQMTITPLGRWAAQGGSKAARQAARIVVLNLMISAVAGLALVAGVIAIGTDAMVWGFGPQYALQDALLMALTVGAAAGLLRSCLGFVLTALDVIRAQSVMIFGNMVMFVGLVVFGGGGEGLVEIAWTWAMASGATAIVALGLAIDRLLRLSRTGPPSPSRSKPDPFWWHAVR